MSRWVWLSMLAVVLAGVLVGCSGSEKVPTPAQPYDLTAEALRTPQLGKPISDSLAAALAKTTGPVAKPVNVLAVSGGGQYAAYNAGLLIGWTCQGTRPNFDVVTGISSGAIVAGYAFLGSKYDKQLQRFFTSISDKDLFTYRPVIELIRSGSIANPSKLEKLIERETSDEFLFDLRQAHQEGRRLYIGTMNVRTRRVTIWDVGAIACSGRPEAVEMVRKVFLAAGSIPGLLPSVKFDVEIDGVRYTEEHVDGGAACQIFVRLGPGAERPADGVTGWLAGSNLYTMTAGKLYAPPLEGKLGFLKRITSTISAALYALYRAELLNLYSFCGVSGMKFHTVTIPDDAPIPPNSMTFDKASMRRLFTLGFDQGRCGVPWRLTPPGAELGEEEAPRDRPNTFHLPVK
jgi:Patatin-like phospholipase